MGSFGVLFIYLGPKSKSSRFLHVLSVSGQERQTTDKPGPLVSLTVRGPVARSLHTACTSATTHEGGAPRLQIQNQREHETDEQLHNNSCLPACLGRLLVLLVLPSPLSRPRPGPNARARRSRRRIRPPPPPPSPPPAADVSILPPCAADAMSTASCRIYFFEFFFGRRTVLGAPVPARSAGHSRGTSIR